MQATDPVYSIYRDIGGTSARRLLTSCSGNRTLKHSQAEGNAIDINPAPIGYGRCWSTIPLRLFTFRQSSVKGYRFVARVTAVDNAPEDIPAPFAG